MVIAVVSEVLVAAEGEEGSAGNESWLSESTSVDFGPPSAPPNLNTPFPVDHSAIA